MSNWKPETTHRRLLGVSLALTVFGAAALSSIGCGQGPDVSSGGSYLKVFTH